MTIFLVVTTLIFGILAIYFSYLLDKIRMVYREREDKKLFLIHELRSPLSSIKAATSLLLQQSDGLDENKKRTMLDLINSQSLQLLAYVSLLLDTSKLQSGMFVLERKPNDIKTLISERITIFQPLAEQKQIRLLSTIKEPLPSFSFDREYISHVIDNLIYNSLKFTPMQGEITISATLNQNSVTIDVHDTGDGMTQPQQKLIFQKFSQAGVNSKDGSGLGLYFVKGIIEGHGGKVSVKSAPKAGTTISFSLPFYTEKTS